MAREGSNLISRNTTLQQAGTVLTNMQSQPLNFSNGTSTVIFSVLQKGGTTGTANFGQVILYQRATYGTFPASSRLSTGSGSFSGPPEYTAVNPTTNTGLQVTNLSDSIINVNGGFLYVTEIFTRHNRITPLDRLLPYGVTMPNTLYSIALTLSVPSTGPLVAFDGHRGEQRMPGGSVFIRRNGHEQT
jgi:hypothetical protein